MKTRAAVLRKGGTPWEITELELDPPKANEVLIRMEAAGLCHSDEHIRARGTARLPLVGGHEGSGVVVEVGPGVTRVQLGDRVSCSYIPVCGKCRYCSTGRQNLCDAGLYAGVGGSIVITGVGYYDMVLPGGILKYALDEINQGYQDLMDGKNLRGVVVHSTENQPRKLA